MSVHFSFSLSIFDILFLEKKGKNMIKYSTLVGEYYDINLQSKEDAIVILNYLDTNDYIEVENIFGQKENIEVGSIVKVSMNNKAN